MIRPQPGLRPEYAIVFRFDSDETLKTWLISRDRHDWLARAKPLVAEGAKLQHLSGLETWFSLPGQPLQTPPRYKMALLTWGAVYVLI